MLNGIVMVAANNQPKSNSTGKGFTRGHVPRDNQSDESAALHRRVEVPS
jgi:hypothetical protein